MCIKFHCGNFVFTTNHKNSAWSNVYTQKFHTKFPHEQYVFYQAAGHNCTCMCISYMYAIVCKISATFALSIFSLNAVLRCILRRCTLA